MSRIKIIRTQKTDISKLSALEIAAALREAGFEEFTSIYTDEVLFNNNFDTPISTLSFILSQPGLRIRLGHESEKTINFVLPTSIEVIEDEVIEGESERIEKEKRKRKREKGEEKQIIRPEGTIVNIKSIENIPGRPDLYNLYNFYNFGYLNPKYSQNEIYTWFKSDINLLASWIKSRFSFYDSYEIANYLCRETGYLFSEEKAVSLSLKNILEDEEEEKQNEGEKRTDKIRLSELIALNQYINYFSGKTLEYDESLNEILMRQFYERLFNETYMNKLEHLLKQLNIKPRVPITKFTRISQLELNEKQLKLLMNKIESERFMRTFHNNCEHVKVVEMVSRGQLGAQELEKYIEKINAGKVLCRDCGQIIMCEHTYDLINGRDISRFYYRSNEQDYCSSCGELLNDRSRNFEPMTVEYEPGLINIISYQFNIIKRKFRLGPLISEKQVYYSILSGIYQDVSTVIDVINSMRGLSEMDRVDRIQLHVYIYVWIYILYMIEMNDAPITILLIDNPAKPKSTTKLKNVDKIMMNMDIDLRGIISRQPSLSIKQIFKEAVVNYFKGNKSIEKINGLTKDGYDKMIDKFLSNPNINQLQFMTDKLVLKTNDAFGDLIKKSVNLYPLIKTFSEWQDYLLKSASKSLEEPETLSYSWLEMKKEWIVEAEKITTRTKHLLIVPIARLPIWSGSLYKYRIQPRTNVDEYKRKIGKYVYLVNERIEEREGGKPENSTLVDLADTNGISLLTYLPNPYVFDTSKDKYKLDPVKKEGKSDHHREISDQREETIPESKLDTDFVKVDAKEERVLYYIANVRGNSEESILKETAPQIWNLYRISQLLNYLSLYVAVELAHKKDKESKLHLLISRGDISAKINMNNEEYMKRLGITIINLIITEAGKKNIEYIISEQMQMTKPSIISYPLLKVYLERLKVEEEEANDAEDESMIEEPGKIKNEDPYANMDYDGENEESLDNAGD